MAVSPRRVSKSRKGMKNAHSALTTATLTTCPSCLKFKKTHIVCSCGFYKGKQVLKIKED